MYNNNTFVNIVIDEEMFIHETRIFIHKFIILSERYRLEQNIVYGDVKQNEIFYINFSLFH